MTSFTDHHHHACLMFADGVATMTRRNFETSMRLLDDAHRLLQDLFRDPEHPDAVHVAFFRSVVLSAAGQLQSTHQESRSVAASGMVRAWEGCKASALGTDAYLQGGGFLTVQANAYYQQAASRFDTAISQLELGLGPNDPELYGPLGDYSGVLRAVGRDADADRAYERAIALPPKGLSVHMVGGGYPIISLDPFGTSPLLPSQT